MSAKTPAGPVRRAAIDRAGPPRVPPPPPLPLRHPALIVTAVVAAAITALAVTNRLTTPDFWQHLLVGKAIWQLGRVPMEHLWTWPSYGKAEVLNSWGFRWLLWPFWEAGDVLGLQVWRWLTTLGAFAFVWAAARQLGARGLAPLVVVAVAALSYRARAQVRPETLAAVLLALQLFVLERRRARGGGAIVLVAIACVWANVHISYYMGIALLGIHLLARGERAVRAAAAVLAPAGAGEATAAGHPGAGGPGLAGLLSRVDRMPGFPLLVCAVAASFLNPFGWRALWQPFEYFLFWRHEPVYRTISELTPLYVNWRATLRSGLPVLIVLWPALIALRARYGRFDRVEALTCALFTGLALFNSRFTGFLMIAIVPYLARDLSEGFGAWRATAAFRPPWPRAALACAVMVLVSWPSWSDVRFHRGIGFVPTLYPRAACDFIESHGLKGRAFNPFYFGGYQAWRFWPDRERLPFMDIHQSGTRRDRELYTYAFTSPEAWNELMREHDFQIALLDGHQEWVRGDRLLDRMDADPEWALVFRDDAAALYLRRTGATAAVADSFGYRVMPGGNEGFVALGGPVARDTLLRRALRAELERRAAGSTLNAQAHSHLANLDFLEGDRAGARAHLAAALAVEPSMAGVHLRLGYLGMAESRWREAILEFENERRLGATPEDEYARMGIAWERLGEPKRAAAAYRKHLESHANDERAREALRRLEGGR